jgi:hypothetical protein
MRRFLLSPAIQARALAFGFRPANPEVKVLGSDPDNPWNRLQPFGLRLLLETWRRVVEPQSR